MKPKPLPSLALLLVCSTGCFHTLERRQEPTREEKLDLYTTTAAYLYEARDFLRAQEQAVKALEVDSDNEPMRRMIGWIRLHLGSEADVRVAERFFRDLVAEGDRNPNTILGLGIACERIGNAHAEFARAIEAGTSTPEQGTPESAIERNQRIANERWDEAIWRIEEILESGEGSTDAMNALQRLYAAKGNLEESLAWSQKLLDRSGAELAAWRRMLTSESLTKEEESAFRQSEKRSHELQTQTHVFAATLLYKLGRPTEALDHLNAVVEESPQLPGPYGMRAQMFDKLGEYRLAIADLDRFLSLSDADNDHPDVRRAFELRARCEQELARADRRR